MSEITLTLPEILSLIGLLQCFYLSVYILMRSAGQPFRAGIPILYFTVLGAAFLSDLAQGHVGWQGDRYFFMQWALWFVGPPLSVILIIQLADMSKRPILRDFWVLLLIPLSFLLSYLAADKTIGCTQGQPCQGLRDLLIVTGLLAGTISLLVIFSKKGLLKNLQKQKYGKERYWLIFSLILLNACFLLVMFLSLADQIVQSDAVMLRNILGLGFVYLVNTSLLRLYPQTPRPIIGISEEHLSKEEERLATQIESLLQREKVYQEPTYSRADLARECQASEVSVSKVINLKFSKSFPQLMNEHRIEDAKRLLIQTDAAIQTIASDVGFNSLPSFNRVFKDMVGTSPSAYRKKHLNS